ncbi:M6 family metalloprotease domain-containing protein, partial [Streptomyces sp. DT225]
AEGTEPATDRLAEFFPQTTKWFRTSSYGRLTYIPEAPIRSWLRMPLPFEEDGIERGSPYEPGYRHLVQDIVAAADPKVD